MGHKRTADDTNCIICGRYYGAGWPVAVPNIFGGAQRRLENTDHSHSLGSLHLPPAALPSLPGLSPAVRVRPPA